MASSDYLFTSESVSEGHPDKVCDRISDEIVDLFLAAEPQARVAAETLTTTNRIVIAGEVRGPASITPERIEAAAREAVRDIGYEQEGFHWQNAKVEVLLHAQSGDIAMGVDRDGAGDQGIMFGYACDETSELMPAPIHFAHEILRLMAEARHAGEASELGPDSKSQITVRYVNGKPVGVTSVVVSTQHGAEVSQDRVQEIVRPFVHQALPEGWLQNDTVWYINPTGQFIVGGPDGDAGAYRPQDHRRHLWRCRPTWRWCVLRQGPDQGRPLGSLCGALSSRRMSWRPVMADRCCLIQLSYAIGVSAQPLVDLCRHLWHRPDRRGQLRLKRRSATRSISDTSAASASGSGPEPPDLSPAPRPMAISAGRRMPMAASRGSGRIWWTS